MAEGKEMAITVLGAWCSCLADSLEFLTEPSTAPFFMWVLLIAYQSYPQEFNNFYRYCEISSSFYKTGENSFFPRTFSFLLKLKRIIHRVPVVVVAQT